MALLPLGERGDGVCGVEVAPGFVGGRRRQEQHGQADGGDVEGGGHGHPSGQPHDGVQVHLSPVSYKISTDMSKKLKDMLRDPPL